MASQVPQPSLGTGVGSDSAQSHSSPRSKITHLVPESDSDDDSYSILAASEHDIELQDRDVEKHPHAEDEDDDEEGCDGEGGRLRGRRGSTSTTQSFMLYTPDEERAVIRKFDRRLVSFVSLLYMLSFLDRSSSSLQLSLSVPPTTH